MLSHSLCDKRIIPIFSERYLDSTIKETSVDRRIHESSIVDVLLFLSVVGEVLRTGINVIAFEYRPAKFRGEYDK